MKRNIGIFVVLLNLLLTGCTSVQDTIVADTETSAEIKADYTTIVTEVEESTVVESDIATDTSQVIEEIVQTDENGNESRVMLSVLADDEPTVGGVNVASVEVIDDSEASLKALIVGNSGRKVEKSFYGDYNKNKGYELFATVKSEDGDTEDLWFTDGKVTLEVETGVVKGTEEDTYVQGSYNENGQTFEYIMATEPINDTNYRAVKSLYTYDDILYDLAGEYSSTVYEQYLLSTVADKFYILVPTSDTFALYPCVWEQTAHRFRLNNYEYLDIAEVKFSDDVDLQEHILNVIKWENGVYTLNFVEDFESFRSKSYIINAEGECQFLSIDNEADLVYGYYPETMLIEPIN